jgi:CubicO group peptidase (beta-lactamase class C family)
MSDFATLDNYLLEWLGGVTASGLALAVTDLSRTVHIANIGYRDTAAGSPVLGETTFQIGSIGKSMTALALMQLVESGRLDLNAPLSTHLPWFAPSSRFGPITLKHVMSHTAGLPSGSDFTPSARYEAYALRDIEVAWEPGERFHYSNTGYKMLGWLLEDVERRAYGEILTRRVLQPLGMNATDAVVAHGTRHRMATGRVPLHDDRPYRLGDTVIPATWMEYNAGDGSPAATVGDMARYARLFLNRGRTAQRAIVSAASFDRMTGPHIRMNRGDAYGQDYGYGYGIMSHSADGHRVIGHGGSTVGFQAIMLADTNNGLAVALLCNGVGVDTYLPARYALQAVAAGRRGETIPDPPEFPDPRRIKSAHRYAGTYIDPSDGQRIVVRNNGDDLRVARFDAGGTPTEWTPSLEHINGNTFCVPDDSFDPFPMRFHHSGNGGNDADGPMLEVHHGPTVYIREGGNPLEVEEPQPAEWQALAGHYRSHAPYVSNFRIVLRRSRLYMAWPNGGEERLTLVDPHTGSSGWFAVGAPGRPSAERIRFDPIVGRHALRVRWAGGGDFYRVT